MTKPKALSKGYTLIEVLVALAIFSSMMVLGGMALNQGLKQYHGLAEKGLNFWDYARNIWIDKSINSALDYYVYTIGEGWFPYFQGTQDGISYVSSAPFASDLPVVVWLQKEVDRDGKNSFVYHELPVYTKNFEELEREYSFGDYKKGKSFKVLEGVEDLQISYYGYDIVRRKYTWWNEFEGRKRRTLPSLIKISFDRDQIKEVLLLSIQVNSLMKQYYNDYYQRQY